MPRIEPAVMHRPYHGDMSLGEVFKQYLIVQEVAVYIMYMDDVGLYALDLLDEIPCGAVRGQAMTIKTAGHHPMPCCAPPVTHWDGLHVAFPHAIASLAIGDIALPSVLCSQLRNLLHDTSRRRVLPDYWIDL